MACACGSKGAAKASKYQHTYTTNGKTEKKTYSSEMDARMAASRLGGTVKAIT